MWCGSWLLVRLAGKCASGGVESFYENFEHQLTTTRYPGDIQLTESEARGTVPALMEMDGMNQRHAAAVTYENRSCPVQGDICYGYFLDLCTKIVPNFCRRYLNFSSFLENRI